MGVDRPPAMHHDCLEAGALLGGLLILARILATSDGKTLRIDGLSGDAIQDGDCQGSFGT